LHVVIDKGKALLPPTESGPKTGILKMFVNGEEARLIKLRVVITSWLLEFVNIDGTYVIVGERKISKSFRNDVYSAV
jgi:hypothetical protein